MTLSLSPASEKAAWFLRGWASVTQQQALSCRPAYAFDLPSASPTHPLTPSFCTPTTTRAAIAAAEPDWARWLTGPQRVAAQVTTRSPAQQEAVAEGATAAAAGGGGVQAAAADGGAQLDRGTQDPLFFDYEGTELYHLQRIAAPIAWDTTVGSKEASDDEQLPDMPASTNCMSSRLGPMGLAAAGLCTQHVPPHTAMQRPPPPPPPPPARSRFA